MLKKIPASVIATELKIHKEYCYYCEMYISSYIFKRKSNRYIKCLYDGTFLSFELVFLNKPILYLNEHHSLNSNFLRIILS